MSKKNIFILGITSDIGKALAKYYSTEGHTVIGTYRNKNACADLQRKPTIHLLRCDVSNTHSVQRSIHRYAHHIKKPWNIFISCVGTMEPIGNFFKFDFKKWEKSIMVNTVSQLRFLHGLYPYRPKDKISHVVFFAGGGTNSPMANYSAYCASKIFLIKMCELLDNENKDLNIFIVGPGWVRTKIHDQTLRSAGNSGESYEKTVRFIQSGARGTSYKDIYDCINWGISQGKNVASGRNFSVVHDSWKNGGARLARQLRNDSNKFKLRRFKNEE